MGNAQLFRFLPCVIFIVVPRFLDSTKETRPKSVLGMTDFRIPSDCVSS